MYAHRLQQLFKNRVNRCVGEWFPISSDKDMIRRGILPQALFQVTVQPRQRSLVKYNEAGLLELGLADQQPVRRNIRDEKVQCFGYPQTSCGEQADQRCISLGPQRVTWGKLFGGED